MSNTFLDDTVERLKVIKPTEYWDQFKGLTWEGFNEKIGMPLNTKTGLPTKIYQYEDDLIIDILKHRRVWVKKATGMGITEIVNRFIAWMCTRDDEFKNNEIDVSVAIITGASSKLTVRIIERIKDLFINHKFEERETIGYINGARVEAFPSSSAKTIRGLSPFIVFVDEGDFFEKNEQEETRTCVERYIIKTNPYIMFVSTPNLPDGLFDKMEREEPSQYCKIFLLYDIGLRDGMYTKQEIEEGMKSSSFEREYNGKYGIGIGNIFPYDLVDACVESFDLTLSSGQKLITVDPAYGSSNFAVLGWEKIDDIIYVKDEIEESRPSPSAMLERLIMLSDKYDRPTFLVDSAHPGLIRDLCDRGVLAQSVRFGSEDNNQSLISKMTFEASQAVREKRVRIHPSMGTLLSQLKAVRFNPKGHPDKTQLNFDSGDCFIMGCNHFKVSKIILYKIDLEPDEDD